MASFQKAPCLVLDDLGAGRMSEWVDEQVFTCDNHFTVPVGAAHLKLFLVIVPAGEYNVHKLWG